MRKARQVEVEYLNIMLVFERSTREITKSNMGSDPIKVRCVETRNSNGIHRSRLVAQGFRKGSKCDAFADCSASPPLELVNIMMSMAVTAQKDE